jgi:hypothetical protein
MSALWVSTLTVWCGKFVELGGIYDGERPYFSKEQVGRDFVEGEETAECPRCKALFCAEGGSTAAENASCCAHQGLGRQMIESHIRAVDVRF